MAFINHGRKEINIKILYWGVGLGGKTQNIITLSKLLGTGKPLTLSTSQGRTLFFDFKPVTKKLPNGYSVRFLIYTTPGQTIYAGARELLIEGTDGIVFVADSQRERHEANLVSLEELITFAKTQGINLHKFPLVFQYNKRDLPDILPVKTLREELNFFGKPDFEAVATKGIGVKETFKEIAKLTLKSLFQKKKTPTNRQIHNAHYGSTNQSINLYLPKSHQRHA